jgi:hypothetical protein
MSVTPISNRVAAQAVVDKAPFEILSLAQPIASALQI